MPPPPFYLVLFSITKNSPTHADDDKGFCNVFNGRPSKTRLCFWFSSRFYLIRLTSSFVATSCSVLEWNTNADSIESSWFFFFFWYTLSSNTFQVKWFAFDGRNFVSIYCNSLIIRFSGLIFSETNRHHRTNKMDLISWGRKQMMRPLKSCLNPIRVTHLFINTYIIERFFLDEPIPNGIRQNGKLKIVNQL